MNQESPEVREEVAAKQSHSSTTQSSQPAKKSVVDLSQ